MKNEQMTAEEYRKAALKHSGIVKSQVKAFLVTGIFALAAAFAVAALTIAWFASNQSVKSTGMRIAVNNTSVELRSTGASGVHDDLLQSSMSGSLVYASDASPYETSASKASINWLLADNSNLNNYSASAVDWSNTSETRRDYAIEPGAHGSLSFDIVPKVSGTIKVKCSLNAVSLSVSADGSAAELNDPIADGLVSGHIRFFLLEENESGQRSLTPFADDIIIAIEDAVKDKAYPYTINWFWPQVFGEFVLASGDSYLNGRPPVFNDYSNGAQIRTGISSEMNSAPEKYFYSSLTKQPLSAAADSAVLSYINIISEHSTAQLLSSGYSDALQAFVDLSSYYNQADQYIGKNVDCIRLSLTAELSSTGGLSFEEE